jgi:hypothetical protein
MAIVLRALAHVVGGTGTEERIPPEEAGTMDEEEA